MKRERGAGDYRDERYFIRKLIVDMHNIQPKENSNRATGMSNYILSQ